MAVSDDSASDSLDPFIHSLSDGDSPRTANEVVEDLTGEDEVFHDTQSSPGPSNLKAGEPTIKPRPYQLEMLEESLQRNIIVAVRAQ